MKEDRERFNYEGAYKDVKYYTILWNFTQVLIKANNFSLEGYEPEVIARKLRKVAPAFIELCMFENTGTEREGEL